MKQHRHISTVRGIAALALSGTMWVVQAGDNVNLSFSDDRTTHTYLSVAGDTGKKDLPYDMKDRYGDHTGSDDNPMYLKDPSNIERHIEYDAETGQYVITETMGGLNYRPPTYMSFEDYQKYISEQSEQNYWKQRVQGEGFDRQRTVIPQIHVGGEAFDRIFGGSTVDIRPQGSAELIFAASISRTDNPALPVKQRRISTFDFQEKIQMNVVGNIGEKLKLTTNYNTEANFDFENQMKLEYTGYEDEIIKKIEAGNVNLPLTGTLITGSQSLFGIKTQLQFGRATVTTIFSQQKGKKSEIELQGGAQTNDFEIEGLNYEANRHFFLSQYFRDQYEQALSKMPAITSGVNITRVEVWITNKNPSTENTRNIIALTDLGENGSNICSSSGYVVPTGAIFPNNGTNDLYANITGLTGVRDLNTTTAVLSTTPLTPVDDYERIESARMLKPTEFSFHPQLGYISLNLQLNPDEVLAVAFQYTVGDKTYQVGEFSTDGIVAPEALVVKMLKSTIINPRNCVWDLMMKNIYAINAYNVNRDNFKLNILYYDVDQGSSINFIPEGSIQGKPLLTVLNLDNLNVNNDPVPDGVFDFIEGLTVKVQNGRIIFPVLEPFGSYLKSQFTDPAIADKYIFQELYDSTKTAAQQLPVNKNLFSMKGQYQSSTSSEISLGVPNVPQGSVKVSANGRILQENIDYTVDYVFGRVKIINEGLLNSGTPIKISLESNSLFNIQSKTLMGAHMDYRISKDFNLGATVLNLTERPLTQKIQIGDEPISNTIWGLDGSYRTESRFLTKMVDKLPFLETKEISTISVDAEFANLVPGHQRAIGKDGTAYIDDFEGSETSIDIKSFGAWTLASTPQGQPGIFPEGGLFNDLNYGKNRAKLAWYFIDPSFLRQDSQTPDHIKNDLDAQSDHYSREVFQQEIFPNRQAANGQPTNLSVLNLAFYPGERGPYNYDVNSGTYSKGLNPDGTLIDPSSRWAGIMRKIETNDFEASNIEFIEFWVMDPYLYDPSHSGGDLYFNLGNISEDVLKDSRKFFEHGLPSGPDGDLYDVTAWGRVPVVQSLVDGFSNDENARIYQDVGFDGLRDVDEKVFFDSTYVRQIASSPGLGTTSQAYIQASNDPSGDNYHYYMGDDYDQAKLGISERYKRYNGPDGNSQESTGNEVTQATSIPDKEDLNRDNTLSENESYFQYHVSMRPQDLVVGQNHITDKVEHEMELPNGKTETVSWYQFRIPIKSPEDIVGSISDFRSIRFMRMYMKNFDKPVICRFATLELVRSEWRKFTDLLYPGEYLPDDNDGSTTFDLTTVNIEENGYKTPVAYILPPGINREADISTTNLRQLNEQSLLFRVCDLKDGDARAAFKNVDFDVRSYKKLRMFIHAEAFGNNSLNDNDLSVIIRLGTDFSDNYYEYEIPLKVTPAGSTDPYAVWPEVNNLELDFTVLQKVKQNRNIRLITDPNINLLTPYQETDGKNYVVVKGNPNLSDIRKIMIGVRNPKADASRPADNDDGTSKCAEVWVNELRLADFDEKGGWAANARVNARLADFGNIAVSGNLSTVGFGSIEKKVSERQRENTQAYDVSSNLELGKFLPEKTGIKVPMYVGHSEGYSMPQFNPLDPDILLKPILDNDAIPIHQRDSIRSTAQTFNKRRSLNFTNVRKDNTSGGKARFYDVSNLSATYAYTESYMRNVQTAHLTMRTYRGGLTYNFNTTPKPVQPFKNVGFLKSKHLRLFRDFNFYTMPSRVSIRTDLNRMYSESLLRNTSNSSLLQITETYNKSFTMGRYYDVKYDLTKSLKLDYNAVNQARIDEPEGRIDTDEEKDSVRTNLFNGGRTTTFGQRVSASYNLPLNMIPALNWMTVSTRYTGNYDWRAASLATKHLGNTIQNSNQKQINGQVNLQTLYNKIPALKKLAQEDKPTRGNPAAKKPEPPKNEEDSTKKKKEKDPQQYDVLKYLGRLVISVKNISVNYSETRGTTLPGYLPKTYIAGIEKYHSDGISQYNDQLAPGIPYVFGMGQDLIRENAATYGWITRDTLLNNPFMQTYVQNINIRSTIQPLKDLKIDVTATRNYSENYQEYFRWDGASGYKSYSPMETGNLSVSFIAWGTAFKGDDKNGNSKVFQKFLDLRSQISPRLGQKNSNSTGPVIGQYWDGYGQNSQDVMIPAFIAAYGNKSASTVTLSPFNMLPKPNWTVNYTGFMKMEFFKKRFKSFNMNHGYRSSFNVGSYTTNLLYSEQNGAAYNRDVNANFISQRQINQVSITEQFSPLINVDATWNNSLITKVEIRKDRNLSMNFANSQLMEQRGRELVIGGGYRIKDLELPIKVGKSNLKSDLNLRADLSFRNNLTTRRWEENGNIINQASGGNNTISIKTSGDYVINERFNVRVFFDRIITKPALSSAFPTSNTSAGVSVRFTLAQ
ncbi:MAG: cell surface protein SprA [Flavobacteriales bacterium]|nr:cell surface protein SprA [Flavobacteriales bacterium]